MFKGLRGRSGLTGLDDLVRAKAPGADAEPLNAAIHECADPLEIRLEAPSGDIVRVTDIPAHDGAFSAKFAAFRHD
jgi:hypothetical protein